MPTATIKYNFATASYEVIADWNSDLTAGGTTIEEAIDSLRHQCNKHGLWPEGIEFVARN
jgi:hypothetical protein